MADRLADLAEQAGSRGLRVSLEFFPWTVVPDLDAALAMVEQAGPRVGVLVDSLHFDRSGSRLDTLRSIPRERLRFAHLCDAPVRPPYSTEDLLFAGRAERLPPGDGEIDLRTFVDALPANLPLALEVPMTCLAESDGPMAVIRRVMAGARRLLGEGR